MLTKIVDTILPTTMVGSYPRPGWYRQQLLGRDIRVAFKEVSHEEAYQDATQAVILRAGGSQVRDIVTDGRRCGTTITSASSAAILLGCHMYERIHGFESARDPHLFRGRQRQFDPR